MQVQDQIAIVTGGASGLGDATARALAAAGAKVAVLDRQLDKAKAVAADIGGLALECDICDAASVTAALDQIKAHWGSDARILMNVAGIGTAKRVISRDGEPAPLEDFERVIRVNLIGSYNMTRLFAARCAKLAALEDGARGVILYTASVAAFDGQIGQQAYSAAKGGINGMNMPLGRELGQFGIRVNSIAPGLFGTPMLLAQDQALIDRMVAATEAPKRFGHTVEFAHACAFLLENGYMNGRNLQIDAATLLRGK